MITPRHAIPVLLAITGLLRAETTLDFSATNEGFTNTLAAGGSFARVTDTGAGSLRLVNPAGWVWRASANFNKTDSGKAGELARALGNAGQTGGFLHFDVILRPASAATGKTGSFAGVQYLVAIQQAIPGGASGWVQKVAYNRPASGFPPTAEISVPVTIPLKTWAETSTELRIHPDSSYYQLQFGTNATGASQLEWHIDNVRVETPATQTGAIQLEAENGVLTGVNVATAVSGFNGYGYVTGFDQPGDHVSWTFTAPAGVHRLLIRFRTPDGRKNFAGTVNGGGFSGFFPASDSYASFDAGLVELSAGTNTLTVGGEWNHYDIDSVTLFPETPAAPPSPGPGIPADPAASPTARALLTYINSNYGLKTYSGQEQIADIALIQSLSGKLPAILAGDLVDYSPSRVSYQPAPAGYTESMITKANEGHILSMCWHWNAPTGLLNSTEQPWWSGFYTEATTFDLAAVLAAPASPEYALLLSDIDAIAVQLLKLQQANIPVLWRPLHESEGAWFWWGAKGPDAFKQLWRLLFTRLTEHHGLHNLLWVLTSEDPAWYPGNDVVDIIGVDAYTVDRTDNLFARWEPLRTRFDGVKPIALTEFGGIPDIEKMQRLGVWWSWFCSWEGAEMGPQSAPPATLQRIYQSGDVITRDELVPPVDPATLDSNNDGVLDSEANALGFSPTLNLGPTLSFFRTNAERFTLGHSQAELDTALASGRQQVLDHPDYYYLFTASQLHAIAINQPFLARDPVSGKFNLSLQLTHSANLTNWSPITPTSSVLQGDGALKLELPAAGDAAFYRVFGTAP